ncbi:MAG: haloacid dehalogenase-like hydrolase, partial [Flavobacteriaceae bacterium]|nr:haloacid dehalogenase-like hydrolase [Flavobacteriaceae bacterium]
MNIAFFDFDHTISTKDSFLDFVAFSKGKTSLYLSLCILAPFLIIYKARLYSGQKIKELVLSYHFKGMNQDEFDQLCEQYGRERINVIINNKASDRIKWHQENNHRIVVVSASIDKLLRYWCEQNCLELIGSRLAIEEGKLSGKLLGKNCN